LGFGVANFDNICIRALIFASIDLLLMINQMMTAA
jgi:hypothetical protein